MAIFALLTDQGTAAPETGVCEKHLAFEENEIYLRNIASFDVDQEGEFVDVTGNPEIECQYCEAKA